MTTTATITEIVQKKIKELPPLPVVVQKLLKTLQDENSSADDVMKVLSSDQALASKVLKLVNSSFYGLSGQVSTPSRAVVILGFAAVRNLAVGLSAARLMNSAGRGHMMDFWDHSVAAASACQILAHKVGYPDPEEAFIAGLLHDIGLVVLEIAAPGELAEAMAGGPDVQLASEEKLLGLTHARAGGMLLKHWKLPKPLCDAARFHHTPQVVSGSDDPLVSLVALADVFAGVHGAANEPALAAAEFAALFAATGCDVETVGEVLAEMDARIAATRVFLSIATGEERDHPEADGKLAASFVTICTDGFRMSWTRQVLDSFGAGTVPVKLFLAAGDECPAVNAIILDPASVSDDQMQKMAPRLADPATPVFLLGGDVDGRAARCLGRNLPTLPLAFSRRDLTDGAGS